MIIDIKRITHALYHDPAYTIYPTRGRFIVCERYKRIPLDWGSFVTGCRNSRLALVGVRLRPDGRTQRYIVHIQPQDLLYYYKCIYSPRRWSRFAVNYGRAKPRYAKGDTSTQIPHNFGNTSLCRTVLQLMYNRSPGRCLAVY